MHYEVGGGTAETVLSGPDGKPFELTAELKRTADYRNVCFPSLVCASEAPYRHTWYRQTGRQYAAWKQHKGFPTCPEG
ncbi:hypothetical protein GCM10018987_64440 [Streptomyces cremeus]